jgi:hypothetical protein
MGVIREIMVEPLAQVVVVEVRMEVVVAMAAQPMAAAGWEFWGKALAVLQVQALHAPQDLEKVVLAELTVLGLVAATTAVVTAVMSKALAQFVLSTQEALAHFPQLTLGIYK